MDENLGRKEAEAILALPEKAQEPSFKTLDAAIRPRVLKWLRDISKTGGPHSVGTVLMAAADDDEGKKEAVAYVKAHGFTKNDVAIRREGGLVFVIRVRNAEHRP